ncbi:cell filamentation protein Fic [Longimonas halophila]|uniref:Cell filamentation protein Fic n=1 Tax=Longimonas halophila TaxID=1469170 RepID=A0A2H3NR28_9BACT|nr:Fic family protein [Longimonas halophila]PEN09657.1 cell filamentation protein Fic [Longimonas halophila]
MKDFDAGTYIRQGSYTSFQPTPINRQWVLDDMEVQQLLSQADRQLGRLDMYSEYVPNLELFIRMHVVKEATQSSRIEGTQTRIEEALLAREDVPSEKRDDWDEVQNYIQAMNRAVEALDRLPFSTRLIRETHRVLMQGVRGQNKRPGAFRTSQNWIGGATVRDAIFVPPVHTSIADLMSDLEAFVHNEDVFVPELIKIAIVHYQFETVHPFLDGNGRVGRLLITLYLVERGILNRPILYLSDFFERNRTHYYDNLMRVRENNDMAQWLKFFLVGVIETAKSGIDTFDAILKLQEDVDELVEPLGRRAENARKVIRALYERPLTDAERVASITGLSMTAAYNLIDAMEDVGLLEEITGAKRNRLYLFERYTNLFTL